MVKLNLHQATTGIVDNMTTEWRSAQDSLFGKLVKEGKGFLVSPLDLIRSLLSWLLSLLLRSLATLVISS